jgi:predicted dehydrogenase
MSLKIAIIGPGKRSRYYYAPLIQRLAGLKKFAGEFELAAIWGRSPESAKKFGEDFGIPWYTDMDKLVREIDPDIGIVSVSGAISGTPPSRPNGEAGLMAVEHGLHVLLETPIAHRLDEADAIIASAKKQNLKIEVSEQFHRRPHMQLILKLIETGIFGPVYSSFNDFAGHDYHGVSVMRSFLGFDAKPLRVYGVSREYGVGPTLVAPSFSGGTGAYGMGKETQDHGIVEFDGGRVGLYHWSSGGYDDPLRWWRSGRFFAQKGMGVTSFTPADYRINLTLLEKDRGAPRPLTITKRLERVDGGNLQYLEARTDDEKFPVVRWDNPFASPENGAGGIWEDDQLAVAGCIMSLVNAVKNNTEPTYGPYQARLDQEISAAIRQSSESGKPITLPMDPKEQTV